VSRILYLDADTIVVDWIDPLWELDLADCYLAAVTNVFLTSDRYRAAELAIELSEYFNSGVLMLNLELMRQRGFTDALVTLVTSTTTKLRWPDQDALNLIVGSRRLALHPRWNCMNSFWYEPHVAIEAFGSQTLKEAVATPAIRHFEGPGFNKPWHLLHERLGQALYREHRLATPWPNFALEGNTPWNRAKRLVSDARSHTHRLSNSTGAQS
jgi:lipopolysaccharide biosynthesis glycosyltransferase